MIIFSRIADLVDRTELKLNSLWAEMCQSAFEYHSDKIVYTTLIFLKQYGKGIYQNLYVCEQ